MSEIAARITLALVCTAAAVALLWDPSDVDAASPAEVYNASVQCNAGAFTNVDCGTGYNAVWIETEESRAAFICGSNATTSTALTLCPRRCVGCNNGSTMAADVAMIKAGTSTRNVRCISGTADAGTTLLVTCAR